MTTNTERARHLIQAGSFLKELRGDVTVPEHISTEADRLVRHYPAVNAVERCDGGQAFRMEEPWFGTNFDPTWWRNYPFKPRP